MLRAAALSSTLILALVAFVPGARAEPPRTYRYVPGGRVQDVRSADVNGDGRHDLLVLVRREEKDARAAQELLVLPAPAVPTEGTFFDETQVVRISLGRPPLAEAGAFCVGRFGPAGEMRLRFFSADGLTDLAPDGTTTAKTNRHRTPTLLGRSPGRTVVFWDAVADLDGDGIDECWFPLGEGAGVMRVHGGRPEGDRTLALWAANHASSDARHLVRRTAYLPHLVDADLDGDGRRELIVFRSEGVLLGWDLRAKPGDAPLPPSFRLELPFVRHDLGPDEVYTPRMQLADADGDGKTDLLVTLVTGDRRKLGSFRTRLLHFPGPFRDPDSGTLVPSRARIDTESVALHPVFVDLDADGALDYVSDSVRGTRVDMIKRVLGQDPTIWYVGFRFDRERGTFSRAPLFGSERRYSRDEAVNNRFGRTGFFAGDFDGDGLADLLDIGTLDTVEILRAARTTRGGRGRSLAFGEAILPRMRLPQTLVADAHVVELDGDGRADAVLRSADSIFLLVSGGKR